MNKTNAQVAKEMARRRQEETEQMRNTVIEQELSARSWKAYWEKMYYTLECEKILPEYEECQKRMKEKADKEREQFENFKKTLAEELAKKNAEDPNGQLEVEGIGEGLPEFGAPIPDTVISQ